MYFIDRGSYISKNNNSHCFDSISQLPGKRGLQRAAFPRAQEGVGGGGGGGTLGAGRESQAGRSGVSRRRDRTREHGSSHEHPYSHLTTELPLTQRHPGPAESNLGLGQAGMSPLLCPGQCLLSAPVLVEVMPEFGSAPPRMLPPPSPPPPAPVSIPVAWTWLSFPPWTSCRRFPRCLHHL